MNTQYSKAIDAIIYSEATKDFAKEEWLALSNAAQDQARLTFFRYSITLEKEPFTNCAHLEPGGNRMSGFKEEAYLLGLREQGHEFVDWFVDHEMEPLWGKIVSPPDIVLEQLNTRYRITIEEIEEDGE